MAVHDELGIRMKEYYEQIPKTKLIKRIPVCIRIDGKAFHTFTRGFRKPFDEILACSMQETMKGLCEGVQGCVLGYTQSDEISLILIDYKKLNSSAWFDYEVQKICSISASLATMLFNRSFAKNAEIFLKEHESDEEDQRYCQALKTALDKGAMFDARCFNIPKEEVTNLIYWRQLDAKRNSISMLGRAYYSEKQLYKKTSRDICQMLREEKEIEWNEIPAYQKWGSCCVKIQEPDFTENAEEKVETTTEEKSEEKCRSCWVIDKEIPEFRGEGRDYVDSLIYVGEN